MKLAKCVKWIEGPSLNFTHVESLTHVSDPQQNLQNILNVFVISLKFNALETISTASVSIIQKTLHYYDWILMDDSVTFVEVPNN